MRELAERMVSGECVRPRAGPVALWVCRHREMRGGREASEWGSFSGRGALAWAGVTGFRRPAFRCSTGPARRAVFEDSAHMMSAGLPDAHLAGQIYVTRGPLVVPGPGGDECGRWLVEEWNHGARGPLF